MELLSTLGPSSLNEQTLKKLDLLGVSMFRINLSHTEIKDLEKVINFIRSYSSVPICIDTEGAQIRTRTNKQINLKTSQELEIYFNYEKNKNELNFYPYRVHNQLKVGDIIYIDFNSVVVEVTQIMKSSIKVFVINGGNVQKNKGVAVNKKLKLEALTLKDLEAISIAKKMKINNFALSFCSESNDVNKLRSLIGKKCRIISKIENKKGFENCREICIQSDSLLIDRGDLSREFKMEDIPEIQKKIIRIAKNKKKKIYVATNFLESMINNETPNRAEINDCYNTLLDGANGLVLAAETAIGKYPVKSALIIKRIYQNFKNKMSLKQIDSKDKRLKSNVKAETIKVDSYAESDIKQILFGTFSPLDRFMNFEEIKSVLDKNKLIEGAVWTLPIVLPIKESKKILKNKTYKIINERNKELCAIKIDSIFKIDDNKVYQKWFSTNNMNHPGIINLKSRGDFFISGQIFKLIKNEVELSSLEGHPKKIKELIYSKGWHNVVGFHSRNIPHNGHIFLHKFAMKQANADGLLISPIIGNKRKGDFANEFLKESYKYLLQKNYYKENSILSFLDIYPRYAGPREAIFTAQCRKNFGCTHFIIGRDHCGVEDYYNKKSNKLFYKQIKNLDIELIFFEDIGYDFKKKKFLISNRNTRPISGSILRDCIKTKKNVPKYLVDSSQIDLIKKWKEKFFV
tara:strand:+ start:3944 stop:6004 length:2061 start_codon:yes stop_codon:yes gene_type:complete